MTCAWGYIRVSGAGQVANGDGLGVQREKITAWCAFAGLELKAIEADEGISGATVDNRPGLKRVLRDVLCAKNGATLVVYKLDRLGRDAIEVQTVLAVLLDAGVRVVALADGVDSASGMGAALLKLLTGTLSAFAELERSTITQRLQDGRRRADSEDRVYASEPRYGRRRASEDGRILIVDPDEAQAVARVRALRAEGLSYRLIGTRLVDEGVRPRRATTWSPEVLRRIVEGRRTIKRKALSRGLQHFRAELLSAEAP
jgi:site-specific DNA recombinase